MSLLDIYRNLPVEVVGGEGCRLYDFNGKEYIDLTSGLGVNILGYNVPEINQVLSRAHSVLHISNLFHDGLKKEIASRLERLTGMEYTFFTNSGTEAVEASIKFAWKTKKGKIIGFEGSFHGRTLGSWSLSHILRNQQFPGINAEIEFIPFDRPEILEKNSDAAILIFDPIQGSGGVRPISIEMAEAIKSIQRRGVIVIADEVQSGMGRTGEFICSHHYGIKPDIVLLGKGLGGGLPLGAVLMSKSIAENIKRGEHGSTMGGNHLALMLSRVFLDRIENGLMERVRELGRYVFEQYREGFDLRGKGLFIGIETNQEDMDLKLLERGFIVSVVRGNIIRLLPPYIIDIETIDKFFKELQEVCLEGG